MSFPLRAWSLATACLIAPLALVPSSASAQLGTPIHYNIAAGLSKPTGDFSDFFNTGYNITVGVGSTLPASPLGFRVEGTYNEFDQQGGGDKGQAGGVTANATFDLLRPTPLQSNTLYLIGGIGYFSTKEPYGYSDSYPYGDYGSQSNVGYNIGAGFKFALTGFSAYIEARYYSVSNADIAFVPISFGLIF